MMFDRLIALSFCFVLLFDRSFEWSYEGEDGPEHWCELPLANQCCGLRQSPVAIDTATIDQPSKIEVEAKGMEFAWSYVNLTNDKHTVVLHIPDHVTDIPTVVLWLDSTTSSDTYSFQALHFHFGEHDSVGSEHHVDGVISPMEMHAVFYNVKYLSTADSLNHPDGVIVFGTQFNISPHNNLNYEALVSGLDSVIYVDETVTIKPGFAINDLLPLNKDTSYSYEGSLTTPSCNEAVRWFVFKDRVPISTAQMNKFRALQTIERTAGPLGNSTHSQFMYNNFRPVQPLNGRPIIRVRSRPAVV